MLSSSARNVSISVLRQRNVHRFGREACVVTLAGIWADTLNWWASGAYAMLCGPLAVSDKAWPLYPCEEPAKERNEGYLGRCRVVTRESNRDVRREICMALRARLCGTSKAHFAQVRQSEMYSSQVPMPPWGFRLSGLNYAETNIRLQ